MYIHPNLYTTPSSAPKWLCLLQKHDIGMPDLEQALGWLPLGLGLVVEDEPSEHSCIKCAESSMCLALRTRRVY